MKAPPSSLRDGVPAGCAAPRRRARRRSDPEWLLFMQVVTRARRSAARAFPSSRYAWMSGSRPLSSADTAAWPPARLSQRLQQQPPADGRNLRPVHPVCRRAALQWRNRQRAGICVASAGVKQRFPQRGLADPAAATQARQLPRGVVARDDDEMELARRVVEHRHQKIVHGRRAPQSVVVVEHHEERRCDAIEVIDQVGRQCRRGRKHRGVD